MARRWIAAILLGLAGVALCVLFVDRPIATFARTLELSSLARGDWSATTYVIAGAALLALLVGGAFTFTAQRLSAPVETATIAGGAVLCTFVLIEFVLKPVFGRTHPPDFLATRLYEFSWFHIGVGYGSFPSGHAADLAALAAVLWIRHPAARVLYALMTTLIAFALIAGEWHFVSDVLAGSLVGILVGASAERLWNRWTKKLRAAWQPPQSAPSEVPRPST